MILIPKEAVVDACGSLRCVGLFPLPRLWPPAERVAEEDGGRLAASSEHSARLN